MQTAYLCNISKNTACTKEWCIIHGGPCLATAHEKYAKLDERGRPVIADDGYLREVVERYSEKRGGRREETVVR